MSGASSTANQIGTLSGFTADGFTLNDGHALTQSGILTGGSSVAMTSGGLLQIGGTVTAASIGLTGSALAIPGLVDAGASGATTLTATAPGRARYDQ